MWPWAIERGCVRARSSAGRRPGASCRRRTRTARRWRSAPPSASCLARGCTSRSFARARGRGVFCRAPAAQHAGARLVFRVRGVLQTSCWPPAAQPWGTHIGSLYFQSFNHMPFPGFQAHDAERHCCPAPGCTSRSSVPWSLQMCRRAPATEQQGAQLGVSCAPSVVHTSRCPRRQSVHALCCGFDACRCRA